MSSVNTPCSVLTTRISWGCVKAVTWLCAKSGWPDSITPLHYALIRPRLVIQFWTQQYKTPINESKLQRGPSRWSGLEHWPCEERLEDQAAFGLKKLWEEKEKGQVLLVCITSWEFHKVFKIGSSIWEEIGKMFCVCLKGHWKGLIYWSLLKFPSFLNILMLHFLTISDSFFSSLVLYTQRDLVFPHFGRIHLFLPNLTVL